MGDDVLAYFGYPQAHEDDAERSVRAGLVVVEAVREVPSVRRYTPPTTPLPHPGLCPPQS